jgi:outer membrane protein TolC
MHLRRCCWLLLAAITSYGADAADLPPVDYSQGVKWFPKIWRAYQMPAIPKPDLTNGRQLQEMIQNGKIELSLSRLNALVEENSLDMMSSHYTVDIAETDLLRAKSGQAARGVPGVPQPGELFASAIGAGVGAASTINAGGTGPTAITGASRQIVIGPRGTFDPDLQIGASFDRANSPLNTLQVAGVNVVDTPSSDFLTRFEKAFSTGFTFSVSFNSQRQSSTQQFLLYNPAYTSRLSLTMYQPLLNGFGFAVNRRFINVAKNDLEVSRQLFRQQVSTALLNGQNAYWDLVAAQKSVEAAQQALDTAQRLYNDTAQQERLGAAAVLDVTQARSATAGSRRDLIIAQTNEKTKELQLKELISKSLNAVADIELATLDPLPEPQETDIPTVQDALKTAVGNRSELIQADLSLRNQRIAEKYTRNVLKPTFSIFATYASSSLTTGVGPLLQQVWLNVPYPEYAAGFSLSITLRNRSAQADNTRAQLEMRQQEAARVRIENQIRMDVESAVIALTQAKAQVEADKEAVTSTQTAFNAEQTKLQIGSSTPYRVIQTQRDYIAAQSQETQAQANYAKALLQLDRVRGTILQTNHVSLDALLGENRQN